MRRLYFIGQGGSSWRDPRNWARERDGEPLRHLHARGDDIIVVGSGPAGRGRLDLRGMPYASVEVNGYQGALILPDGSRATFPRQSSRRARVRAWILRRHRLRPVIPRGLVDALGRAGGWQQAVRDGLATLILTRRGWAVVPLLGGGAYANVRTGTVATNGGGTGAVSPTYSGGLTTTGNLLVGLAAATVSTSGGTWTVANARAGWVLAVSDTSRTNVQSAIFYRANCGTNESPPTFQYSNSATVQAVLMEFSGALKVSPLDQTGHSNALGGTTSSANGDATCAAPDVASGELIVTADAFSFTSNTTMSSSDSYNSGAPTGNLNNDATSTRNHYRFAYGITTSNAFADLNTYDNGKVGAASTAAGCIASFKVAINITKTGALPYEATQALAATAVDPYEALKGIQATAAEPYETGLDVAGSLAEPYEALGGVQKTGAEPYESLRGIAGSAALPYEALLALAVAKALPYETLLGVRATASEPFESLSGLSVVVAEPYETVAGVAASGVLPYEVLLGVASNAGLDYESLRGLASSAGLPYEVLAALIVEGALPFEALGGVAGQTAAFPFESLSAVAAAISALPYEALAGITAAAGSPFEALAALAALAELPVESLADVAAVVVLPYETTGGIHVQALVVLPYETAGGVALAGALPYEALVALAAASELPYETLGYHLVLLGVTDGVIAAVVAADGRVTVVASTDGEKVARVAAEGSISAIGAAGGDIVETASTDGSIHP